MGEYTYSETTSLQYRQYQRRPKYGYRPAHKNNKITPIIWIYVYGIIYIKHIVEQKDTHMSLQIIKTNIQFDGFSTVTEYHHWS